MANQKIVIVTDSAAHIPPQACQGLNIATIPLWLIWDGVNYRDEIDITNEAFYERLRRSKTLPTTSQPTAHEFAGFYKNTLLQAQAVVSIHTSSKISGTVASAQAAAADLPGLQIRVVDSYSTAMGLGLIVLCAARAAAEGESLDEVSALAEQMRERVQVLFAVDTLEYLHKGGRISGGKHLLGSAFNIKPILHFQDGQIKPFAQARSKKKAIDRLLDIVEERLAGTKMAEACVMDVDTPAEGDGLARMVSERFGTSRLLRSGVSPVVGTHAGPGTVGIAFYGE